MARLGDYVKQIRGVSYKPEDLHASLDDSSIILLRANNIQDGKLVLDDVVFVDKSKVRAEQLLKQGDVLICTSSGSKELVGKAAFVEADMNVTFGAFCKVVRPVMEHPRYLGHYFNSAVYRKQISALSAGANINNIRGEHIDSLEIQIPSINEQVSRSNSLSKIDELISLRKKQLQKLDDLVKSRFVEMFGDYDLSLQKTGWYKISQIGTVVGGSTPKTNVPEYWNGEYRWISPAELKMDSGVIFDSAKKITKAGIESCSLQELPIGTVILSSRAPIGKVAIAGNTFYCNQGFKNIICSTKVKPRFLYTLLFYNTEYLNSLGRGATFKEISKSIVEEIRIPVPPIKDQERFVQYNDKIDGVRRCLKQGHDKLEQMKQALMQKYFG